MQLRLEAVGALLLLAAAAAAAASSDNKCVQSGGVYTDGFADLSTFTPLCAELSTIGDNDDCNDEGGVCYAIIEHRVPLGADAHLASCSELELRHACNCGYDTIDCPDAAVVETVRLPRSPTDPPGEAALALTEDDRASLHVWIAATQLPPGLLGYVVATVSQFQFAPMDCFEEESSWCVEPRPFPDTTTGEDEWWWPFRRSLRRKRRKKKKKGGGKDSATNTTTDGGGEGDKGNKGENGRAEKGKEGGDEAGARCSDFAVVLDHDPYAGGACFSRFADLDCLVESAIAIGCGNSFAGKRFASSTGTLVIATWTNGDDVHGTGLAASFTFALGALDGGGDGWVVSEKRQMAATRTDVEFARTSLFYHDGVVDQREGWRKGPSFYYGGWVGLLTVGIAIASIFELRRIVRADTEKWERRRRAVEALGP